MTARKPRQIGGADWVLPAEGVHMDHVEVIVYDDGQALLKILRGDVVLLQATFSTGLPPVPR